MRVKLSASGTSAILAILIGGAVMTLCAVLRGQEYDEAYTLGLVAGQRLPAWPDTVFAAGDGQAWRHGSATLTAIAASLRGQDVHPPLYFWLLAAWRQIAGPSWLAARLLSVLAGTLSLALIAAIARACCLPAALAVILTALSYGFAYTGSIARGFALAQCLGLIGILLLMQNRNSRAGIAFTAGLALGLASVTNYLTAFSAIAMALWLLPPLPWTLSRSGQRLRTTLGFCLGAACLLPADLVFFLAQRHARPDQFPAFDLVPILVRIARYQLAAMFGGLPLYAGRYGGPVAAGIVILALALISLIVHDTRQAANPSRRLLLWLAIAPACGLFTLALLSGTAPIELRYFAFGLPAIALLLAAPLARHPILCAAVLLLLTVSVLGLALRPETMQPQAATAQAAARADALVLVPNGNDGAGIPLPFIAAAPPDLRLRVIPATVQRDQLRAELASEPRVAVAALALDPASRATLPIIAEALTLPCWEKISEEYNIIVFDNLCLVEK